MLYFDFAIFGLRKSEVPFVAGPPHPLSPARKTWLDTPKNLGICQSRFLGRGCDEALFSLVA